MKNYSKIIRELIKAFFEEKETSYIEAKIAVTISCFTFLFILFLEDKEIIINSAIAISTAIAAFSARKALSLWKNEKEWSVSYDIAKEHLEDINELFELIVTLLEFLKHYNEKRDNNIIIGYYDQIFKETMRLRSKEMLLVSFFEKDKIYISNCIREIYSLSNDVINLTNEVFQSGASLDDNKMISDIRIGKALGDIVGYLKGHLRVPQ